jgi:hypothetical protein
MADVEVGTEPAFVSIEGNTIPDKHSPCYLQRFGHGQECAFPAALVPDYVFVSPHKTPFAETQKAAGHSAQAACLVPYRHENLSIR